jgi:hypothetical protein
MAGKLMTAQKNEKMPVTVTVPTTLFSRIFSAIVGMNFDVWDVVAFL